MKTNTFFEIAEKLCGPHPISYIPNKLYPAKTGTDLFWYINSKGFLHVQKPRRINEIDANGNKVLYGYEIVDYLIKDNGDLKEVRSHGYFKNREDCVSYLLKK